MTQRNDPIELLNKIKVLMHDPIRAKYPFASLTEAISRMLNLKQSENEGLLDYVKRFKESRDIMKSHGGTDILDKFVENTLEYRDETDTTLKKEMKNGALDRGMAYLLICNSDQAKYGSLSNGLVSQFSMQNNQYPRTCTTATDILSNHRFDNGGNSSKKKWNNRPKKDEDENSSGKTTTKTNATNFAQGGKDKTCYCCGKAGHLSPGCPDKNTIKQENWHINTQYYQEANQANDHQEEEQEEGDNESYTSTTSKASSQIGWSGLIVEQSLYNDNRDAKHRLKNCITLDNGSTLSLFSNPDIVQNIRTSSKTHLSLATNAGVKQSNCKADVPGFVKVYHDEDAIANIFGFSDLKKKHRITYDSDKEDAFLVHMDNKIIKF
jgi:hypothetical protein